jgi:cell volume regulation protein A
LLLRFLVGKDSVFPELFIAPRGLITILLFYSIPEEHAISDFNHGILFLLIIVTSIIMTYAMIKYKKLSSKVEAKISVESSGNTAEVDNISDNMSPEN